MTKTKDEGSADLQSAFTTGHPAIATSVNQAGIGVHADRLRATSAFNKIAGQPFMFVSATDAEHEVFFGPTRTGMSAGPILPQVLDLANKPKR